MGKFGKVVVSGFVSVNRPRPGIVGRVCSALAGAHLS